jgi:hypothetical protein
VALRGEKRNTYRVLMGKPEGGKLPRRPKYMGEYNIKMDFKEA